MIAAAIATTHMTIILTIAFIMIAICQRLNSTTTASAATWSVVGRFLHSSWCPDLVGADSASKRGVPLYIVSTDRLKAALIVLTSVASIVTPRVISNCLFREQSINPGFDTGDFCLATIPRSNLEFSRICGGFTPAACANSFSQVDFVENATGWYSNVTSYDSRIPQYVIDVFESGLSEMNNSVSSICDIQARTYSWGVINDIGFQPDDNGTYPVESYRQISTMITNNEVLLVEGLMVDMVNGGIGFRNHSAPPIVEAFVNLNQTYPTWEMWVDRQENPDLELRAYKAAWLNNAYSMVFMNVTTIHNDSIPGSRAFAYLDSELGKTFPIMSNDSTSTDSFFLTSSPSPDQLITTTLYGGYLDGLAQGTSAYNDTVFNVTEPSKPPLYLNPFGINSTLWSDVGLLCTGAGGLDFANISDNGIPLLFDLGSNWTVPIYSSISSSKGIIKTVSFRFNGSDDFSGLTVTEIEDKVYADDDHKPLWSVEQTNLTLNDVSPLWGLVTNSGQGNISLSTVRKESLYLPGYTGWSSGFSAIPGFQNLPGLDFYVSAIGTALNLQGDQLGVFDYTGRTNNALLRKWQELSKSAATASRVLNLIWTAAANAVVGTKTLQVPQQRGLQKRANNDSNDASNLFPQVILYKRRVQYRWPYGIPAFIALLFTVALTIVSLIAALLGHSGPGTMRRLLKKTSLGRVLTSSQIHNLENEQARGLVESSEQSQVVLSGAPTKEWGKTLGKSPFALRESEADSRGTELYPIQMARSK
ncbi:hypothetical protein DPV78_004825 [Talaromyces pinophilus]|nr:hypothetical protein DPV78_004825 [Talaromyces pinophilus]